MSLVNTSHLSNDQKEKCTICLCPFDDPRIIECTHVFCFPCLTQHIEHSRQDHGRSFKCPICRHEFQIQDQSLTSDQIANRFPQKIIRKRIQRSRLLEHKRKSVILDTNTKRNNISNKHDFSKPNCHQPKLNNHNVIPKIPSAPYNTPSIREIRVDSPMDMNSSIVNRNPLHVPVINRRFLEPSQVLSADLPNIYSPNAEPEMNRHFLKPAQVLSADLPNIYSPNAEPEMNRHFLKPAQVLSADLPNIYSPNAEPEMNRHFLKPAQVISVDLPNIYSPNAEPEMNRRFLQPAQVISVDLPNIYSPNAVPEMNRRFQEPGQFPSMDFHLPNIYSPNAVIEMNSRVLDPVERYTMDLPLEIDSNSPIMLREINRPFLEPLEFHQTNFYLPNITIRNEIPYPRQKYNEPEVRRNNGALRTLSRQAQSLTQFPRVSNKTVIHADMPEYMQEDCFDCGFDAMERFKLEKEIAAYIKKEFDRKYNSTWHCIVGSDFGSYVTYETNSFIYFQMRKLRVVLFKSG